MDPQKVWPEYPRPQLVRKEWTNLNGLWEYAITGHQDKEPDHFEGQILVPFAVETSLSGVMRVFTADQVLWYKRHFTASLTSDESLILHFGAVDYESHIFINGHKVGDHKGGYNRFYFDVTKFLVPNKDNTLVLKVIDATGGGQPLGKQNLHPSGKLTFSKFLINLSYNLSIYLGTFYSSTSGIWQTVWTEKVPKTHIKGLVTTPDVDNSAVNITVMTSVPLKNIEIKIMDREGKVVASVANAVTDRVNHIKINSPKLWSTVDPYLYDIHVKAGNDSVTSYTGLRKMEVKKDVKGINRFHLNGKPIFMLAPLDQGFWPESIYTPPSEEAMINDFLFTRKVGFNAIRKHVKVESDRWYYTADRMGFVVWQDFPSAFGKVKKEVRDPEEAKQIEIEMERMVTQLHNFPSIIMWIPFNENWGQYDSKRIVNLFKTWDPSRLVNEASGWTDHHISNIEDHHSYPTSKELPLRPDRVVINGEYGGGGLLIKDHNWDTQHLFIYQALNNTKQLQKFFVDRLATVRAHAMFGLGAAVYTQITDVEREVNGLITYDREVIKVENIEEVHKEVQKLYPLESVEDIILAAGLTPKLILKFYFIQTSIFRTL